MPPSRRLNNQTDPSSSSASSSSIASKPSHSSTTANTMPSSLLPAPHELLLLSIFPFLLVLGSLFSLLSNPARYAPYNPTSQSHPPELAPSYFALKRNILNTYFVKFAWFWVSVAFWLWWLLSENSLRGGSNDGVEVEARKQRDEDEEAWQLTPQRLRSALRWAITTSYWFFVTQWFFGPSVIDRAFKITGGACERVLSSSSDSASGNPFLKRGAMDLSMGDAAREVKYALSAGACKAIGGQWKGGYDISGHVFILVLGVGFLGYEVWGGGRNRDIVDGRRDFDGILSDEKRESDDDEGKVKIRRGEMKRRRISTAMYPPMIVVGLSLWMLLMTAVYFHTWFEKFLGLVVALGGIWSVYILPREWDGLGGWVGRVGD